MHRILLTSFAAGLCVFPAAASADMLYISDFNTDTIYQVDSETGAELNSYSAPSATGGPQGLAVSADGKTLYAAVAFTPDYDVLVFDTLSGAQIGQFSTPLIDSDINGLALSADGSTLYASNRGGFSSALDTVVAFDTATGSASNALFGLDRPQGLLLAPDGQSMYVANADANNVVQRRLSDGQVLQTFTNSNLDGPSGLELSPDGSTLYVANDFGDFIVAFETATGDFDLFNTIFLPPPDGNMVGLAMTADGSTLFAADAFNDRILQFDTASTSGSEFFTRPLSSPTYLALGPSPAAVPEPGTFLLSGLALIGTGAVSCRRRTPRKTQTRIA